MKKCKQCKKELKGTVIMYPELCLDCVIDKESAWHYQILCVYLGMNKGRDMKNLKINAFGDVVERGLYDYGTHKNQLNLFDNLNEIVEENRTANDILDFLFNRKGNK